MRKIDITINKLYYYMQRKKVHFLNAEFLQKNID
jgi:hypothetical protein